MNASLALCAAVLSAMPTAQPTETRPVSLYPPVLSQRFDAVIRGQTPAELTTPMMTVPTGPQETTVLQPVTPDGGVPSMSPGIYGTPSPGPTFAAPAGAVPYAAPGAVGGDPFLTDPNFYTPGGPNQSGRWGWYFGYDATFLKPVFKHNMGTGFANGAVTNVEWDLEYSPRFWVGVVEPDGTGLLARYFNFDHSTRDAGGGQKLDIEIIDFEKTWHHNTRWGALTASGGVRFAWVEQELSTNLLGAPVRTDTGFHGLGPTVAINGRHRVNNSNLALFAGARLSLLFGNSSSFISTVPLYEEGDDLVAVTDLQVGGDWSTMICHNTRFFIRAAFEGQFWHGAVNTNAANVFGFDDGNFGLFGFTVGTGFAF